jgi:hypothetical protein
MPVTAMDTDVSRYAGSDGKDAALSQDRIVFGLPKIDRAFCRRSHGVKGGREHGDEEESLGREHHGLKSLQNVDYART